MDTMSIEDAAKLLTEPESNDQPDQDIEADVSEVEADEVEASDDEPELEDEQPEEVEADADADDAEVEEAEEDDDDPLIHLDVGGKIEEVKFSELTSGYMRNKDYTQKTQALADERKSVEAAKIAAREETAKLQGELARLATMQEPEPDWSNVDPQEYPRLRHEWDRKQAEKQKAAETYSLLKQQQHEALVAREQEALYNVFPEWRQPEVMKQVASELSSAAADYGFTEHEMAMISDHRFLRVLNDLSTLKKGEKVKAANAAKVAKKVAKASKRSAPASKPAPQASQAKRQRQQMDRLKKTGSIEDALALLGGS